MNVASVAVGQVGLWGERKRLHVVDHPLIEETLADHGGKVVVRLLLRQRIGACEWQQCRGRDRRGKHAGRGDSGKVGSQSQH